MPVAGKVRQGRYCDAAKFFFAAISAYSSMMRTPRFSVDVAAVEL
jgi:hypothetical protein